MIDLLSMDQKEDDITLPGPVEDDTDPPEGIELLYNPLGLSRYSCPQCGNYRLQFLGNDPNLNLYLLCMNCGFILQLKDGRPLPSPDTKEQSKEAKYCG